MDFAVGLTFLGVEVVLITLTLLAIVRIGLARLGSSIGITRDGFPPGKAVPSWSLPDLEGHLRFTPAEDHWQFLIFANRSLVAFPDLINGIHHLVQVIQELEVLILSHERREDCEVTAEGLELKVPVVSVNPAFYDRFRVRVVPFAFLLDPHGVVHWVGLINTEAQLFLAWRMSQAVIHKGDLAKEI